MRRRIQGFEKLLVGFIPLSYMGTYHTSLKEGTGARRTILTESEEKELMHGIHPLKYYQPKTDSAQEPYPDC